MSWQLIETAPKNEIINFYGDDSGPYHIGWVNKSGKAYHDGIDNSYFIEPTHWSPVLPPPVNLITGD